MDHISLENLEKPPLQLSLPSAAKVSCVWSAGLVAEEGDGVLWYPFCILYNSTCSIFYLIIFFATDASQFLAGMNWGPTEINKDIQMQREGLV